MSYSCCKQMCLKCTQLVKYESHLPTVDGKLSKCNINPSAVKRISYMIRQEKKDKSAYSYQQWEYCLFNIQLLGKLSSGIIVNSRRLYFLHVRDYQTGLFIKPHFGTWVISRQERSNPAGFMVVQLMNKAKMPQKWGFRPTWTNSMLFI